MNNISSYFYDFNHGCSIVDSVKSSEDNLVNRIQKTYKKAEHGWGYLGKILVLSRHLLNLSLKVCHQLASGCRHLDQKIFKLITRTKLFSIVGVGFSVVAISSTAQKIIKSIKIGDHKGVAFDGLSISLIAMDIADSIMTFVNAALLTMGKCAISAFSTAAMPLAFVLVGTGSISKVVNIINTRRLLGSINLGISSIHNPQLSIEERRELIEKELTSRLFVSSSEIQIVADLIKTDSNRLSSEEIENLKQKELQKLREKKKASLLRASDPETAHLIEGLVSMFENNEIPSLQQGEEALKVVKVIEGRLKKKMTIDFVNLASNILILIGLSLFLTLAPPLLPFVFLAAGFILKIAALAYQDLRKT